MGIDLKCETQHQYKTQKSPAAMGTSSAAMPLAEDPLSEDLDRKTLGNKEPPSNAFNFGGSAQQEVAQ